MLIWPDYLVVSKWEPLRFSVFIFCRPDSRHVLKRCIVTKICLAGYEKKKDTRAYHWKAMMTSIVSISNCSFVKFNQVNLFNIIHYREILLCMEFTLMWLDNSGHSSHHFLTLNNCADYSLLLLPSPPPSFSSLTSCCDEAFDISIMYEFLLFTNICSVFFLLNRFIRFVSIR